MTHRACPLSARQALAWEDDPLLQLEPARRRARGSGESPRQHLGQEVARPLVPVKPGDPVQCASAQHAALHRKAAEAGVSPPERSLRGSVEETMPHARTPVALPLASPPRPVAERLCDRCGRSGSPGFGAAPLRPMPRCFSRPGVARGRSAPCAHPLATGSGKANMMSTDGPISLRSPRNG